MSVAKKAVPARIMTLVITSYSIHYTKLYDGFAPWIGTITDFKFPEYPWSAVYTHVPFDRPYPIPSDFDPNLALALVWGDDMNDAKQKAAQFIDETVIKGHDSHDKPIITNLQYLKNNLDRLLAF